jgi:hypothetical protein
MDQMSALLQKAKAELAAEKAKKQAEQDEKEAEYRKEQAKADALCGRMFKFIKNNLNGTKTENGTLVVEIDNNRRCNVFTTRRGQERRWNMSVRYGSWHQDASNEGQDDYTDEGFIVEYENLNYNYRNESKWYPSSGPRIEDHMSRYDGEEKLMKEMEKFLIQFLKERL